MEEREGKEMRGKEKAEEETEGPGVKEGSLELNGDGQRLCCSGCCWVCSVILQ